METQLGAFALRQILASTAVVGPILILIGLCYYLFKQDRKSVYLYLIVGVLLTFLGASVLYVDLARDRDAAAKEDLIEAKAISK